MKNIFTFLFFLSIISMVNAQLENGTEAPDFTVTDINGNQHSLYDDYLSQGYTVVLDFSATWCGPCWSYHQTHALADLYRDHGPAGMPGVSEDTTDDVMVLFLEVDNGTTSEDLAGTGPSTQGNWIEGTPYPIIDDAGATAISYAITAVPTIYTVCPSGVTTITGAISAADHFEFSNSNCITAEFPSDARIVDITSEDFYCGSYTPELSIQNLGNEGELTSATITASQNGIVLSSIDWTGSLSTFQSQSVTLPSFWGIDSSTPVIFTIFSSGDMNDSNDQKERFIAEVATTESIEVQILTDDWGIETSWDIKDPGGNIVAQGGGYSMNTEYSQEVDLFDTGCYSFNIYDSVGDGICCTFGDGYYKLLDQWGNEIYSGGEFAYEDNVMFNNKLISSISEASLSKEITLFPNPANNNVTINFNAGNGNASSLEILNTVGEVVYSEFLGSVNGAQTLVLDVAELSSGLYFVSVSNDEFKTTQELSIIK